MKFAEIILPLHIPNTLTYGIPMELQGKITPGIRVEVNMGKNKLYAGLVAKIHNTKPDAYEVKPIKSILDENPIVSEKQLTFWQWISSYYMCSIGEVMNAALPAHLKLMSETLMNWSGLYDAPPAHLSDDAFLVAEALHIKQQLSIAEIRQILDNKNITKTINELLENEIAIISEYLEKKYSPKIERFVFLNSTHENETLLQAAFNDLEKAPKQLALLMYFLQLRQKQKAIIASELIKLAKTSNAALNGLIDKGILYIEALSVDRIKDLPNKNPITYTLSEEQQSSLQAIHDSFKNKNITLLHGVTGSGKTLIYIDLIKEAIRNGKQSLLLLPEIALTTQVVSRLKAYFGEELGVYHSKFSNNERVEVWNKVNNGKYKVIFGARSALWLPFNNLQYIIIDEEHDTSFKQHDPAPRFHARDAAIYLGVLQNAKILLGTATPSMETMHNVQNKKYDYVTLKERYRGVSLPEIEIVSAKNTQAALSTILTTQLLESIQKTLQKGQQVILFQNKRGYAPFLLCNYCGWIPHCKYCDVSQTYHKSTDMLHCHYCGNKSPVIKHCLQCGNQSLTAKNFGTEKIEEELLRIFPKYKTARMDFDTTRSRDKQQKLLDDYAQGRIDILVGTQMVVKGLDFENVGLVGIISADSLMSYPDFRVNERAFQLMEQVSGRAGRLDGKGKVIIQAYNINSPVLQWVKNHDYKAFYLFESDERQKFHYPPFTKLIKITCKHKDETKAGNAALHLSKLLKENTSIQILGPAPALVPRVKSYYLQELMIKFYISAVSLTELKNSIAHAINDTLRKSGLSSVQFVINVDVI